MKEYNLLLSFVCALFVVLFFCLDMHLGSVPGSLSNPSLTTLATLCLSLYPAVSGAFICTVMMPVFLVMGQHLILEGTLEAQMQEDCHLYEEF